MSSKTPTRYTVAGITDERDTCDCCGKTDLKRVVVLLDLDSREFVFFGTTCAARNTGRGDITSSAKGLGKVSSPARALVEYHERRASGFNRRAQSILKMANGAANRETRDEAQRYFEMAVQARRDADAARAALAA